MPLPTSSGWPDDVIYPESDGKPMAENPQQARVIRRLVTGFRHRFRDRADVFVDGDFFWYPVEGDPTVAAAPDVTVIDRLATPIDVRTMGSYRQWVFGGRVLLAVEVLSPSNTWAEMARKRRFYERHGVEEYWVFDPADGAFEVYLRDGAGLRVVADPAAGFASPTTGVRARVDGIELVVEDPDGRVWLDPEDEIARADQLAAEVAAFRARLAERDEH